MSPGITISFEKPAETQFALHIIVAENGDYFEICCNLPQRAH